MKMTKRVIAIVLSLILAVSMLAISASALDGSMAFSLQTSSNTYSAGDAVVVNIYVSNTYKATCLRIPVLFSADVFEIPASNNIRLTAYNDCRDYKGSLEANTSNDGSYTPDAYSSGDYSAILIQWTASVTSTKIGALSESATPVQCFSFQLNVKSTAGGKTGSIFIPSADETDLFYDQAVTDDTNATTICRVNTTVTTDSLNIEIEQGEADGITTYDGSNVIIDHTAKILKNWPRGITMDIIRSNVKATGDALLVYSASTGSASGWGTGATVAVATQGGETLGEYKVLFYGDVDGDGDYSVGDITTIANKLAYLTTFDGPLFETAGDVNLSGDIDVGDITVIANALSFLGTIDQAM